MKNKKQTLKSEKFLLRVFNWMFLIGLFAGIWIPQFRWRLISTAIVCLFFSYAYGTYIKEKEKK